MRLVTTKDEARRIVMDARRAGQRVGVVPTMGALHAGHLSLVRTSNADCDFTAATIFVNPTQFGPNEDFSKYPRKLQADLDLLASLKVDMVFAPEQAELYGVGHSTFVDPPAVALPLEGAFRPDHFRGVATIVLKLFQIIPADLAYFGQKDYQQTLVIRHMVHELDVPVRIQVRPTVREADGLALSSRNVYLTAEQRQQALAISQALKECIGTFRQGEQSVEMLQQQMRSILRDAAIHEIDYAVVVDGHSLQPVETASATCVALIAAHVGKTRLIDNVLFS